MSYTTQTWANEPATSSPLNAARLNYMEAGIAGAYLPYTAEDASKKGAINGYAPLNASGQVPAANLPSYVDDVLEYANLAAFPATGATGIIYTALDTSKLYRWSGSIYIELSPSPGTTDALVEGSTNLYYTNARADARVAAGITGKADKTTTVSAGTGLTGGGDLSANRTLAVAYGVAAGTAAQGNDSRLSDARTPTAHTHPATDITTALAISQIPTGTSASTVCVGNDSRLSDARTPVAHVHAGTDITTGTVAYARLPVGTAASTIAAGDDARFTGSVAYSRLPVGTTASTVAAGNDSRLSDTRTPSANSVTSSMIVDGTIQTADIGSQQITTALILNNTIVDGDIDPAAAIALTKLGTGRVDGSVNGTATNTTVWRGTTAQYNAIGTKDPNTVYLYT